MACRSISSMARRTGCSCPRWRRVPSVTLARGGRGGDLPRDQRRLLAHLSARRECRHSRLVPRRHEKPVLYTQSDASLTRCKPHPEERAEASVSKDKQRMWWPSRPFEIGRLRRLPCTRQGLPTREDRRMISPNLPNERVSFAVRTLRRNGGGARARALVPVLAERAPDCEKLRRMPDETERDLHHTGLVQGRAAGAWSVAPISTRRHPGRYLRRRSPRSVRRPPGTSATCRATTGCWATTSLETQDEIWDASPDTLIATSLAFACGRGRKVDGGYEVIGPLADVIRHRQFRLEHAGLPGAQRATTARRSDLRFALVPRS